MGLQEVCQILCVHSVSGSQSGHIWSIHNMFHIMDNPHTNVSSMWSLQVFIYTYMTTSHWQLDESINYSNNQPCQCLLSALALNQLSRTHFSVCSGRVECSWTSTHQEPARGLGKYPKWARLTALHTAHRWGQAAGVPTASWPSGRHHS